MQILDKRQIQALKVLAGVQTIVQLVQLSVSSMYGFGIPAISGVFRSRSGISGSSNILNALDSQLLFILLFGPIDAFRV